MSGIQHIMIPFVRKCFSASDIATTLYENGIAEVSSITLVPVLDLSREANKEFKLAYITIEKWLENSEPVKYALDHKEGYYLDMHNQDMWLIKVNVYNDGNVDYAGQTTKFLPRPRQVTYESISF
jgi:hypothetical protein